MINKDSYRTTYDQALQELSDLMDERESLDERREEIDNRLSDLRKALGALAPLCGQAPWTEHPEWFPEIETGKDIGLTQAVRQVLHANLEDFLSPVGVREGLRDVGYEIKSNNILPSIHNVLKRLDKAGVVEKDDRDGRTWYRWKGPIPSSDQTFLQLRRFLHTLKEIQK